MRCRIGKGGDRRDLRDQPVDLFLPALHVEDVLRVRIKSRKRAERRFKHSHRMGVVVKTVDDLLDAFVDEGVVGDVVQSRLATPDSVGSSPLSSRYATSR